MRLGPRLHRKIKGQAHPPHLRGESYGTGAGLTP